jgi:glycosyltransferase involved in cell wall biosynthesis
MQKIRVLALIDNLGVCGSYVQLHSQYINKDYFEIIACGMFERGVKGDILRDHGIKTEVLYGDFSRLKKLLKEVDVLHFNEMYSHHYEITRAAVEAGVPGVIETNIFGYVNPRDVENCIDSTLSVSKDVAWTYMRRAKMSVDNFLLKNAVLYEPIDIEGFERNRPSEQESSNFRSSLGVNDNTTLICRVGRPDIAKWSPFIIHMLWYLARSIPVKLLIVGGTPKWITEKIAKYHLDKNVIDIGVVEEKTLHKIYYSIDMLTHCSRIGESFGRTIGETMAARKPVVVNSSPWMDNAQIELVDNWVTGFVTLTSKTFADAVVYLVKHPELAKSMGQNGYEKAKKEYDAISNTKLLEKHYLKVLLRKGFPVDKELLREYEYVYDFPSKDSIRNYPVEYQKRLKNYFGNPSLVERSWIKIKQYTEQRPRRGYIFKDTHLHIPPVF